MSIIDQKLNERSGSKCEMCGSNEDLRIHLTKEQGSLKIERKLEHLIESCNEGNLDSINNLSLSTSTQSSSERSALDIVSSE